MSDTADQVTTHTPGAQIDGDGQTVPGQGNDTGESQNGSEGGYKPPREKRYREERNAARQERDALAARVEVLQTRELERIASEHLSNPADLLTLSGKSLADFLNEDGDLDAELVTEAANEVLGSRPGLRPNQRAVDPSQGLGGTQGKAPVGWEALFQR